MQVSDKMYLLITRMYFFNDIIPKGEWGEQLNLGPDLFTMSADRVVESKRVASKKLPLINFLNIISNSVLQ